MKRLHENLKYIKVLNDCNKNMRDAIINTANKELIHTICECTLNCINGNVPVSEHNIKLLKKQKNKIKALLKKRNSSIKQKKKLLIQQGSSFLPIILSTILSSLGPILFKNTKI